MKKTHKLQALTFLLVPLCTQGWSRANLLPLSGSVAHFLHLLFARYPSCYEREAGKINLLGLVCTWKHCPCPNPREEHRGYLLSPDTPQKGLTEVRLCQWQQVKGMWIRGTWLGGCGTFPALSPFPRSFPQHLAQHTQSRAPCSCWAFVLPRTRQHYQPMIIHLGSTNLCTHGHNVHFHGQKLRSDWGRHQFPLTLVGRAAFSSSFCSEALQLLSCSR